MLLVPTSYAPPRGKSLFVERSSITDLTGRVDSSRLTVIGAAAGTGKTTAALFWFEHLKAQGRPGLWLAARGGIESLSGLLGALKEAGVTAGYQWERLDPRGDSTEFVAALVKAQDRKPVLVIDDAQMLPADAMDFIARMVASTRDGMTTIIVSRGVLPMAVARMRALGQLVEVGSEDLRFGVNEARELISLIVGAPIDATDMQNIVADMDGWASGLVLAGNAYRDRKARGGGWKRPSQGLRAELMSYLEEEILADQPDEVRDFLLDTSVLAELTPAVCAAVTGDDNARERLQEVTRSCLFIDEVDQSRHSYRYHPLFRKLMLDMLVHHAPERLVELHRRASCYFAETGDELAAIEHARLSDDQEFRADQLERMANGLIYAGYLYRIDDLGSELPWSVISTRPMLLLALAWRRIRRLSFSAAERFINAAAVIAESRPEDLTLQHLVRHRRIMLESARDNLAGVERDAEALLFELGDEEPYLSCTLLAQLMTARRELYHFHDMLKLEAETRRALQRPGSEFASIALKSTVAPFLSLQGKTGIARQVLEEALSLSESRQGSGSGLAALPALPLAELHYEAGELDKASELVTRYLPVVHQWGFVDQLASGYLVRARLAFARGDTEAALAGLEEAHLVAIECGLDRLRAVIVAEQVRILVKTGQVDQAEAALRAGDIHIKDEPVPTLTPTRKNEIVAIAWLRIEIQRNRLARAQKVAMRWLELVKRSGANHSTVMFNLLLAEIAVLQGNRSKARRAIREAIELSAPANWIRTFLDEGELICSLLSEAYSSGPVLESSADTFASRIVSMMAGGPPVAALDEELEDDSFLTAPLAARELEILSMVSGGLHNREIGQRLGLTEGTVKWYLQQVYDKLGVRRRSQAVLRARQFGLLG